MIRKYVQLALKVLARRKFFTFISLFGISLTLLVLMVTTALLDHVFAPHPPEVHAGRTLGIYGVSVQSETGSGTGFLGYKVLDACARDLPGVEETSFFRLHGYVSLYRNGEKLRSFLKGTDASYWSILDFDLLEGRTFDATDFDQRRPVVVINRTTREKLFGRQSAVLGQSIEIDGRRFEIVGVVEDVPIVRIVAYSDLWVPYSTARNDDYQQQYRGDFMAILLAGSRADFPRIRAEFEARVAAMPPPDGFDVVRSGADTFFEFMSRQIFGDRMETSHAGRLRWLLTLLAFLFLLLPTLNLVNLNLSRILERASEIGVRRAFGASCGHLVVQFVIENVVLTLLGGLIGFLLSVLVLGVINRSGFIPYADFGVNLRVFLWGMLFAVVFGVLSGVFPAWRMARLDPVVSLKGSST
ncbi:MAG: ABC transporter permease [Thermoanaerobaculia bacterium]|nr:ABC transporter permease [Thermoanaerobaculia bacterium]